MKNTNCTASARGINFAVVYGCVLLAVLVVAPQAARSTEPSFPYLTQLVAQQHNHRALRGIVKLLALSPDLLLKTAASRYELLMLRGQALLNLHLNADASASFTQAARATANKHKAVVARATAELISHSQGNVYVSHDGKKLPYLSPEDRATALKVFYADIWQTLQPQVQKAQESSSLPPIISLLPMLRTAIDLAAAMDVGDVADSVAAGDKALKNSPPVQAFNAVSLHLEKLISGDLKKMQASVTAIGKSANQRIARVVNHRRESYRRGLSQSQAVELQDIARTCREIVPPVKNFAAMFPDFPLQVKALNATLKTANAVYASAMKTLQES